MAGSLRHMVGKILLPNFTRRITGNNARTLYSPAALGLDNYLNVREKIAFQFRNVEDKFRSRMRQYLESPTQNMIFTEDLKNMVHLVEKKDDDLDLCLEMIKRFNNQNKELRFGTFIFGPIVMRMFHFAERPDLGLKALKDKELDGFFDQITSFQILMDSFYKTEQYEAVLEVFQCLQERQLTGSKYPKDCVNLALAACYKMNSKESYDTMLKIIQGTRSSGSFILRKGVALAAALALKQNNPAMALEITSLTTQTNYITIRNIRLMAMAEMDRVDEVFGILSAMLNQDVPETRERRLNLTSETMGKIRAAVKRSNKKEYENHLQQVEKLLQQLNNENEQDLESVLCSQVPPRRETNFQRGENQRVIDHGGGFDRGEMINRKNSSVGYPPRFPYRQRKGLRDIDE